MAVAWTAVRVMLLTTVTRRDGLGYALAVAPIENFPWPAGQVARLRFAFTGDWIRDLTLTAHQTFNCASTAARFRIKLIELVTVGQVANALTHI